MTWQRRADAAIGITTAVVWPANGHAAAAGWLLLMFVASWTVRVPFCLVEAVQGWREDR